MKKQLFLLMMLMFAQFNAHGVSQWPTTQEFYEQIDVCANLTAEQEEDVKKQVEWLKNVVTPANITAYFQDKYDDLKLVEKNAGFTHKDALLDFEDIVVVSSKGFAYRNIKDSKWYAQNIIVNDQRCPLALHFLDSMKENNFFISSSVVPSPYRGTDEPAYTCVVVYGSQENEGINNQLVEDSKQITYKLTRVNEKIYAYNSMVTILSNT